MIPVNTEENQSGFWRELYGNPAGQGTAASDAVCGTDFWKTERLYTRSDEKENRLGAVRYTCCQDGTKDILHQFGEGLFMEVDGIAAFEAEYALENSENAYVQPHFRMESIIGAIPRQKQMAVQVLP